MDTTDVAQILWEVKSLEDQIVVKEERLTAAIDAMQRLTTIASLTPHSPSSDKHWMEPIIATVDALRTEIEADKAALPVAQHRVHATIALVSSPLERKILTMRYCARLSWDEIAQATGYSTPHLYRMQHHALEEIAQHH